MREIYKRYISEPPNPKIQHKSIFLNFIWILEAREQLEKLSGSGTLHSDKVRVRGSPERDILSLRTLELGLDRFGASFRRRFSKVGNPRK